MGEFRLTNDADADLLDLFVYGIERFGLRKAESYRDSLAACFQLLAEAPRLGRKAVDLGHGVRRHEHASHVVFYEEQPYGVLILAVIHARSVRRLRPRP